MAIGEDLKRPELKGKSNGVLFQVELDGLCPLLADLEQACLRFSVETRLWRRSQDWLVFQTPSRFTDLFVVEYFS
jgi:hypothetical protein